MFIKTSTTNETTWAALKAAVDNGTIAQGDLIVFNLKNGEEVAVSATQDKKGKWFFVLEDCLADEHCMNKRGTNRGAWAACDMRQYLNNSVFALLPDELQALIAPTKIVQIVDGESVETEDKLFLLSKKPLGHTSLDYSKIPTSAPSMPRESPSCPRICNSLEESEERSKDTFNTIN